MTVSEGYQAGLAGHTNARHSPEYCLGWEAGWRERMLVWNSLSRPADEA